MNFLFDVCEELLHHGIQDAPLTGVRDLNTQPLTDIRFGPLREMSFLPKAQSQKMATRS